MDVLKAVLDKATLPLALVVLAIALALIFHRKLSELIERTTSIEIDPMKRRWRVEFGQRVQQEQQKAAAIQRQITAQSPVLVPPPPGLSMNGADQTGRDIVLEAWGAVKQAVYDGCMANGIAITPTGVREALQRLRDARTLALDLVRLVESVYDVGHEVGSDRGRRPRRDDARAYANLAHGATHLLALSVLPPLRSEVPEVPQRHATLVGGDFVQPSPRNTNAALVAVSGPMKGQQDLIDKSNYRLGRNANNELCAAADDGNSAVGTSRRPDSPGRIGVRSGGDILEREIRRSEGPRTQGTRPVRRLIEREARRRCGPPRSRCVRHSSDLGGAPNVT